MISAYDWHQINTNNFHFFFCFIWSLTNVMIVSEGINLIVFVTPVKFADIYEIMLWILKPFLLTRLQFSSDLFQKLFSFGTW